MQRLHFKIDIQAPVSKVYDKMLGNSEKSSYEQWTHAFNPTSTFEGSWEKGSKILFVGVDSKGEKGGMVSRIVDNTPQQFVSIQHYGMLKGGEEITSGPEVESWANSYENYTFNENNGVTTVTVDVDSVDEFTDYMNEKYPAALLKLKVICEG
jgi:hypothetical protein